MTKPSVKDFEQSIADKLHQAGIPFVKDAAVGGLRSDFLITTPKKRSIVIETVHTEPTWGESSGKLMNRLNYYKEATGAHKVLFVSRGLVPSRPQKGLVTEKDLIEVLNKEIGQDVQGESTEAMRSWRRSESLRSQKPPRGTIFAAMPFSAQYEDTFFGAMVPAAKGVGAVCIRVDQEKFQGDVVVEIRRLLQESNVVIADLSEPNPNVFFEAGFAHALKLPVIHISSAPRDQLPFDVRNLNTIKYAKGQTYQLKKPLSERLKTILGSPKT